MDQSLARGAVGCGTGPKYRSHEEGEGEERRKKVNSRNDMKEERVREMSN
jgi:hypothetical protein